MILPLSEHPLNAPPTHDSPYMRPMPHLFIEPTCNCKEFLNQFPEGTKIIRTSEGEFGHWAVILKEEYGWYIIVESNYIHCEISYRGISKDDPRIIEVYKKLF